jgi:hypothetical protein
MRPADNSRTPSNNAGRRSLLARAMRGARQFVSKTRQIDLLFAAAL